MAHDFLGTFNRSQFERFIAFARSQLPLIVARRNHLNAELARVGQVVFQYNNGIPLGYAGDPPNSYMGKLLAAYEVLGGDPFKDLRVRMKTQPVFIIRGDETTDAQVTSGGEPLGGKGLLDGPTAVLMTIAKGWLSETLHGRFNRLERKIRRAMDYTDQLTTELEDLERLQQAAEIEGSLEFVAAQVEQLMGDRGYRAIYDDKGEDPFGQKVYAPLASYDAKQPDNPDVEQTREIEGTGGQKQSGGYTAPGTVEGKTA